MALHNVKHKATTETTDHDDAVMIILSRLEQLKNLASAVGDDDLANRLGEAFDSCLVRYCDSKRAELNDSMRHHFKPPREYLN